MRNCASGTTCAHAEQAVADRQRDAWLDSQGYRVLRFWNHEVLQELDAVLERIRLVAEEALTPNPSPGQNFLEKKFWPGEGN